MVARNVTQINAKLEDHQVDYQPLMVELEGKISDHPVSILIDPGASLSYVIPIIVYICDLKSLKFKKPWLVQLATSAKRRLCAKVEGCEIKLAEQ